jgi:hypothetical protein
MHILAFIGNRQSAVAGEVKDEAANRLLPE